MDPIARLRSVREMAANLGFDLHTHVHSVVKRYPKAREAEEVQMEDEGQVIRLERTRSVGGGGEPVIYSLDVFPQRFVIGVSDESAWSGSLMRLMEVSWGITITHAEVTTHAARLAPQIASRIRVRLNLPWITLEQTNFDAHQRRVLYSLDYYRGDTFSFRLLRDRASIGQEITK